LFALQLISSRLNFDQRGPKPAAPAYTDQPIRYHFLAIEVELDLDERLDITRVGTQAFSERPSVLLDCSHDRQQR
jgi:hypothetical protein